MKPSAGVSAAVLWMFAALCGAAIRYVIVTGWAIWTPDGRLAVSPGWFTIINTVQLAATGAVFFVLMYPRQRGSQSNT